MDVMFRFLLAALATWRLAFLLTREDGPGRIFARWREKLGVGFFGQLFTCVKCTGMWVSIPFALFVRGNWLDLVVIWLALSGVTALIDEWIRPPFEWQETNGDKGLPKESECSND
jgi:hypothetical protein